MAAVSFCGLTTATQAAQPQTFTVDCAKGQTISAALDNGDSRKPMVLTIQGTCNENITIARDDVTLQGDPKVGATVNGSSAAATIAILANRITVDRLAVTGGTNGVLVHGAFNAVVKNAVIQNNAQNGIFVLVGHARITNNTIQYASGHGVSLQGGNALLSTNLIQYNTVAGVHLEQSATVNASGNTISSNGSNGVELRWNSQGQLTGNTISGNGFSPPPGPGTTTGVHVRYSTAGIEGGRIFGNATTGVGIFASVVEVTNVEVSGNNGVGIGGSMGSTFDVTDGTISGNGGVGISAGMSIARIRDATVSNNAQPNAILISQGSKLTVLNTVATGNGGYGLQCSDGESSYTGALSGTISPTCTGF
jgi:parallel beta-helix repeat protein